MSFLCRLIYPAIKASRQTETRCIASNCISRDHETDENKTSISRISSFLWSGPGKTNRLLSPPQLICDSSAPWRSLTHRHRRIYVLVTSAADDHSAFVSKYLRVGQVADTKLWLAWSGTPQKYLGNGWSHLYYVLNRFTISSITISGSVVKMLAV